MSKLNKEFEVRFLEVDVSALKKKLKKLGAKDKGEVFLRETIIYDKDLEWPAQNKLIRVRENGKQVEVTYKHQPKVVTMGSLEINLGVDSAEQAIALFESVGLRSYRRQEKRRHEFRLGEVTLDIDTWPKVPPYIEIEGVNEGVIKKVVQALGLDWNKAIFDNARAMLEKHYGIPMSKLRYFTFDRVE